MYKKWLNLEIKSINTGAIILALSSLVSRILGILRDRILAGQFGTSDTLDIYYASFQIPDFFYNIFILGTLSIAFIPIITSYIKDDKNFNKEMLEFTNTILNLIIIIMGIGCFLLMIFAPALIYLVAPGFSGEKYDIAVSTTRIMLLSPFIFSISSIFSSILVSYKRFISMSLAPILYNLGIIFGAFVLAPILGVKGLTFGVIIGALLHMLLQYFSAKNLGFTYKAIINYKHSSVSEFFRLFIPRMAGIDISQASLLIGSIIGSTLNKGSITIFNLTNNIQSMPLGIFSISIVSAAFPHLSLAFANKNFDEFSDIFYKTASKIFFFLIPASFFLFILRKQLITFILFTGKFTQENVILTSAVLGYFCLSIFSQGITPLILRSFYSLHDTLTPFFVNLISISINVAMSLFFIKILNYSNWIHDITLKIFDLNSYDDLRVIGLSIGFSVTSWINLTILYILLHFKIKNLHGKKIVLSMFKFLISSIISGTIVYFVLQYLEILFPIKNIFFLALIVGSSGIIGIIFYLLSAYLLKAEEVNALNTLLKRN